MKLTEHFSSEEFIRSNTASAHKIDNSVGADFDKLKSVAEMLEKIRVKFGAPIWISSGYRSPKLNSLVHGSSTSQHCKCEAADIKACKGKTNGELFKTILSMIKSGELKVGQLIWEKGNDVSPEWVHISIPYRKVNDILKTKDGKTYTKF